MTKPTIPTILPLIKTYYSMPGNSTGGNLHIVLEDGNTGDAAIRYCLNQCLGSSDDAGIKIAWMLLSMSKTQRMRLCCMDKAT